MTLTDPFNFSHSDFVASTKHLVIIAPANQNCCGDKFICYGNNGAVVIVTIHVVVTIEIVKVCKGCTSI